jgi:hypothetical protein
MEPILWIGQPKWGNSRRALKQRFERHRLPVDLAHTGQLALKVPHEELDTWFQISAVLAACY